MRLFYQKFAFALAILISFISQSHAQTAPEIEGTAGLEVLPTGWDYATPNNPANSPNTPDMVGTNGSFVYEQYPYNLTDLNGGASPAGGNAALLLKNPISDGNLNPEGIATTITGLISGMQYKIIVYWQQVQIVPPPELSSYPSYSGGSLRATIDANTPQIFNSLSSYNDGWQTAEIIFTAAQTTARIALEVTGLNNALDQRNVIVVDYKDNIIPLPVNFASIQATVKGSILNIDWSTESETNNDYFEPQISKDGINFTSLATLRSKADNGFSTGTLTYSYSVPFANAIAAVAALGLLGFLTMAAPVGKKRLVLLLASICLFIGVACTKNDDPISATNYPNLYARLKQVDKDGRVVYSKIVKVVIE